MSNELTRKVRQLERDIERLAVAMVSPPLSNSSATVAPTVNDDSTLGYGPLSQWLNVTTDTVYVCCDATAGAAVWKQTTP